LTTTATKDARGTVRTILGALIGLLLSVPACTSADRVARPAAKEPTLAAEPTGTPTSGSSPSPTVAAEPTGSPTPKSSPSPTVAAKPTGSPTPKSSPSPKAAARVDKLLVIMAENRSAADVSAHMPYLKSQSRLYGTATNYHAITYPSLPNYLVIAGGSTFGVRENQIPDEHPRKGPSVFGQLLASGRTAKTYAEAMPHNCTLRNKGAYVVRHNPWAYFADPAERSACRKYDVPSGSPTSGALADDIAEGHLPSIGLLIPDNCHNGHDCSIATTDRWLRSWLPTIKNGPDFRSGRLAVIITWDEDDRSSGNHVAMVVIHPALKGRDPKSRRVTTRLTHYALSATISRVGRARPLRDADEAPDLLAAFGLN
jgi:phosphatidylinositol-3-phosphatase